MVWYLRRNAFNFNYVTHFNSILMTWLWWVFFVQILEVNCLSLLSQNLCGKWRNFCHENIKRGTTFIIIEAPLWGCTCNFLCTATISCGAHPSPFNFFECTRGWPHNSFWCIIKPKFLLNLLIIFYLLSVLNGILKMIRKRKSKNKFYPIKFAS